MNYVPKEPPRSIYLHNYDDAMERGISLRKIDEEGIKYIRADLVRELIDNILVMVSNEQ